PPGDPKAQFVPMHGVAFPTVTVPVLKDSEAKNTVITESMITTVELPEDSIKGTMITDASYLLGKAPKIFLKAGQPIFETEVAQISLVDVPVLNVDVPHDETITKQEITTVTLNAAELPRDTVYDASQLIGHSPRRLLVAGAPIRRTDVQLVRQVKVPV